MRDFKDLEIWKKSIGLFEEVYRVTSNFPKEEIYGLTCQLRRAVVGIVSNIAEGCGRRTSKDFVQFLYNAYGSIKEVECQLIMANKIKYLDEVDFNKLMNELNDVGKMLRGFVDYISGKEIK